MSLLPMVVSSGIVTGICGCEVDFEQDVPEGCCNGWVGVSKKRKVAISWNLTREFTLLYALSIYLGTYICRCR